MRALRRSCQKPGVAVSVLVDARACIRMALAKVADEVVSSRVAVLAGVLGKVAPPQVAVPAEVVGEVVLAQMPVGVAQVPA